MSSLYFKYHNINFKHYFNFIFFISQIHCSSRGYNGETARSKETLSAKCGVDGVIRGPQGKNTELSGSTQACRVKMRTWQQGQNIEMWGSFEANRSNCGDIYNWNFPCFRVSLLLSSSSSSSWSWRMIKKKNSFAQIEEFGDTYNPKHCFLRDRNSITL